MSARRPNELEPGHTLGDRYRVDAVLGRGGFGVVYLATSLRDGRQLALKTWTRELADLGIIRRFQQEAEVWIALGTHPYIVQAYRVDVFEGRLFIAMEYVAAGGPHRNSLDGWLESGAVEEQTVVAWAIQICHAMEYASKRGIRSHRDLKPANVMVDPSGSIKITDFGLATHPFLPDGTPELPGMGSTANLFHGDTVRGIGFGTPAYMPPEQFRDAAASDRRTDIYALGIIMYELLTGRKPVHVAAPKDPTMENRLRWWKSMEQAHLALDVPDLPFAVTSILGKCLQKHPTDRYPDFGTLRNELEALFRKRWGQIPAQPDIPVEPVRVLMARADSLRRLERWAGAASIYREIVGRDATQTRAWSHLGSCLAQLDNHKGAEMAHIKAVSKTPDNADHLARWGHARFLAGRLEPAEDLFRQALVIDPACAEAHLGMALVREREGRMKDAMSAARRAVEYDPSLIPAWLVEGRLAARHARWKLALKAADRVLQQMPQHRQATADRACWLTGAGRFAEAETHFRLLRRHGALKPLERMFRAVLYTQTDRVHQAVRDLAMAQGTAASSVSAIRATTWARMGRWSLVESELDRAKASGDHPVPAIQRAVLHHTAGRHSEAAAWAALVLSRYPDHLEAAIVLAASRLHMGQTDTCLGIVRELQPEPSWQDIRDYNLGVALLASGQAEEAWTLYLALAERRAWPDVFHNAGVAALMSGRNTDAKEWLLRAHEYHTRPLASPSPWLIVFRDTIWPVQPERLVHVLSNGFEPRFRSPLVRPMVLLWPAWIPDSLLDAHD